MAKILHAEDDDGNRRIVLLFLKNAGYEVVQVNNGIELLEKAGKEKPDLIISDFNMPGKNGIDALKELRARGDTTKFILFSSAVNKTEREQVEKLGGIVVIKDTDLNWIIFLQDIKKLLADNAVPPSGPLKHGP